MVRTCRTGTRGVTFPLRVRRAREDELEDVEALDRECFPGLPYDFARDALWVASLVGEVVGYASARDSKRYPGWVYLSRCAVHPDFRGHGLQKRLIRARVRWAKRTTYTYTLDNPASGNALMACGFRLFQPDGYVPEHPSERWWRRVVPS